MTRSSKELYLDPKVRLRQGKVEIPEIKLNEYQKGVKDVRNEYTDEELKTFYRDMTYIREFEQLLFDAKRSGIYHASSCG